ncbi:MAG: hypothetical protein IM638_05360 [Bacteroidetes bacterium]|nr:hypothetical protein [Bacteroidota bacterium]
MSESSAKPKITITRTAFTNAFFDMEKQLDVAGYTYNGRNIWPVVRRKVMYDFFRAQHQEDLEVNTGSQTAAPASGFHKKPQINKRDYLKCVAQIAEQHKDKVLFFFSATQKPSDFIQGKGYFRHLDPYYEWLCKQYNAARIQVAGNSSIPLTDLMYPVDVIASGDLVMDEMRKLGRLRRYRLKPTLGHVQKAEDDVIAWLKKLNAGFLPSHHSVSGFAERVFAWEELLQPLIAKMRPRAVFMPCYFCDQQTLALTSVCHRAGVPVIDIQHGGQDNPMYYGWHGAAGESPYLAHYFWMWSDYFTRFTSQSNAGPQGIPFTGGNLWMQKSLTGVPVSDEIQALRNEAQEVKRTVVVSLQRGLADHVLAAMKELPKDWRWLVRFHPVQTDDERKLINEMVAGLPNVETLRPTKVNLYHLLQLADVHITGWSTIAVEALQLGVPTIFSHPNAEAGYGRLIGTSGLRLETGKAGMIAALMNAQKVDAMPLLEPGTEIKFPQSLLNNLLSRSL